MEGKVPLTVAPEPVIILRAQVFSHFRAERKEGGNQGLDKNNQDSFRLAVRSIPTASRGLARERVIWGCICKASSGALCAVHRGTDDIWVSVGVSARLPCMEDLPVLQLPPLNLYPALSIRGEVLS